MRNKPLKDMFNVHSLARLTRPAHGFPVQVQSMIRDAELVLVFDHDTDAKTVAAQVMEAYERTGIQRYELVSRDSHSTSPPTFTHIPASVPVWSQDVYEELADGGDPRAEWKREFIMHIEQQWAKLREPVSAQVSFSKSFLITAAMDDKEREIAAYDDLHALIVRKLAEAERTLQNRKRARMFDRPDDEALAHRALCTSVQDSRQMEAFVFFKSDRAVQFMQERLLHAAAFFQVPAATDFNGRPLIAFPGDTPSEAGQRTVDAKQKLGL